MRFLMILIGVVCFSLTLLSSCAPQHEQQAEPIAETPQTTEADIEAIKAMLTDDWAAALKQEDVDALMSAYSDDAISMPPGEPAWVGRQAIRAGHERNLGTTTYELVSTIDDVVMSGEWAFVRGNDRSTQTPKSGGDPTTGTARWLILVKRHPDGTWKIFWEMFNWDGPLPAAQTE